MCPAVNTPIAKPMINVPNRSAAFGNVSVRNSSCVSTGLRILENDDYGDQTNDGDRCQLQFIHFSL